MGEFNRYWAEEALGEPYAPQDYRWLKTTRRAGMLLGGFTCVLTTSALLGAGVYHLVDPTPRVSISSYEIELAAANAAMPTPSQAAGFPVSNKSPEAPAPTRSPQVASTARQKAEAPRVASTAPSMPSARSEHTAAAPPALVRAVPPVPQAKAQVAIVAPGAGTPDRATLTPAAPEKRPLAKAPDVTAAAKPEADTRIGLSKAAESKPADIAPGEKLGIREILPDGIVMQNGRRVKNGSALPNGEILMGTDAAKGMAETDRRVLVLTP